MEKSALIPNLPASSPSRHVQGGSSMIVGLQLHNKHVLIIGGGREAANRTFFALDADAKVTLISPHKTRHPAVKERISKKLLRAIDREFREEDLELRWPGSDSLWAVDLVLVCIDDKEESQKIAALARKKRIPINCADIPELCDFFFMAQFRAGDLQIGVSTKGGGPRLGARIRNDIVAKLNSNIPQAVTCVGQIRRKLKEHPEKTLSERMGWISRFCDSWTYEELAQLEDRKVQDVVIEAFIKDQLPEPPKVFNAYPTDFTFKIPPQLTSVWWCPTVMGFYPWLKMLYRNTLSLVIHIIHLAILHVKLIFLWPFLSLFPKPPTIERTESSDQILASRNSSQNLKSLNQENGTVQKESSPAKLTKLPLVKNESIQSLSILKQINGTSTSIQISFMDKTPGSLYLVGAGPGDPDMITVQALKVIKAADIVVSDRLIPIELLNWVDEKKLILSSFKVGGKSDQSQDESNEICLKFVKEGKMVVRFKTGDPFVFGRGGEEILFFRKYGIDPIIIPGLSSVFAAPTNLNIPPTHRNCADQVLILSGRGQGGTFPEIPEYYHSRTTIILMSLSRLDKLVELMIEKGYPANLDAAVIEKGTWKQGQRICRSPLNVLNEKVTKESIENPALLIVGNVVSVLDKDW